MAVVVLTAACGERGPEMDPRFGGQWSGSVQASFRTLGDLALPGTVTTEIEGFGLRLRGFCPDGSGELLLPGVTETEAEAKPFSTKVEALAGFGIPAADIACVLALDEDGKLVVVELKRSAVGTAATIGPI